MWYCDAHICHTCICFYHSCSCFTISKLHFHLQPSLPGILLSRTTWLTLSVSHGHWIPDWMHVDPISHTHSFNSLYIYNFQHIRLTHTSVIGCFLFADHPNLCLFFDLLLDDKSTFAWSFIGELCIECTLSLPACMTDTAWGQRSVD